MANSHQRADAGRAPGCPASSRADWPEFYPETPRKNSAFRHRRRRPLRFALVAAAGALAALLTATPAAAVTLTIACGAVGIEVELCREGAAAWAARSGHHVELVQTPALTNDRLGLFQQLLAARSPEIDVFQIDVVWPGILGVHLADLRPLVPPEAVARHFAAIVENNTVAGELKALPWFTDVGLLYYRQDLLERYGEAVPATWDALAAAARRIVAAERAAGDARLTGLVFQGKAYEGLTCNALEWLAGNGGGLLHPDGRLALTQPANVAALERAAGWIGTIAGRGVLNYAEEEARGVFQAGHAVFMRNWPYAWPLVNAAGSPVRGRVGLAALPRGPGGNSHPATLGGWNLAVSRYSRHPALAADLVVHLTAPPEQSRRALKGGFLPTIPGLYEDPALLTTHPHLARIREVLRGAVARPSRVTGPHYNRLSHAVWRAVHDALAGQAPADRALADAQRRLERVSRGGRW